MKRSWIGAGLLVLLLGCGVFTSRQMQQIHTPIAADIARAETLAKAEQWETSVNYVNQAKRTWEDRWGFAASFADHEPMERINALFAQLEVCAGMKDTAGYCLICAQLQEELNAMGEAHRLFWWNLL